MPSRALAGTAVALALGLGACSQAPKPQPVSAAKPATAQPAATAAPAAPAAEKPVSTPAKGDVSSGGVVVIDPGEEEGGPKSLVDAARAERQRKAHAGEPVAVITNKSLPHSSGQLTQAKPAGSKTKGKEAAAGKPAKPTSEVHDEAYWRQRGLDIRVRWRKASEDVDRLEKEAAELRRRFYAQDDPAVRDAQVKPEWDRTLELLDKARLDVKASEAELAAFMEEGRRAGALPGWLREGTDKEPEKKPAPPSPTESMEPQVLPEGPPR